MDSQGIAGADVLVALKMAAHPGAAKSVRALGEELGISKSSVANSQRRLVALGLFRAGENGLRPNKIAFRDFLENGLRWVAPASVGDFELGLPTAHSADVLSKNLMGDEDHVVIPLPHGPVRGRAVSPLHPLAPQAAARDAHLHRLLAVVDAFRIGRARDKQAASKELRAWL